MKKLNLTDEYMNPADFRFFCTDWAPNGTSTLIVVDQDGQVVGTIDEALFGPPLDSNGNGEMFGQIHYCDGEAVWPVDQDQDLTPDDVLYPLTLDRVLSSVAVSPVQSRFGVLREVVKLLRS